VTLFCYYNKYHSKNRIHNLHYEKFQDGTVKCIEDEIPFEVPEGWEWVRLVSICLKVTDGTHHSPDNFPTGEYKYITAKNIKLNGIVLDDITYVTAEVHKEIFARCNPEFGDILYIKDGATSGIATVNTLHEEFSMLSSVALLKPSIGIDNWYMCYAMQSPYFYNTTRGDMKGVGITRITLNMLTSRLIPIPPQNEQRQISANTSKLIELIVSIEKSKDDVLELIATTKSKILDLAIRGKLVPQDSNDEPASILLERIRAEKEELIKQGKIKRDKKKSVIFKGDDNSYYEKIGDEVRCIDEEIPFDIPDNWEWIRLKNICNKIIDGSHNPPKDMDNITPFIMASSRNINFDTLWDLENVRYLCQRDYKIENERTNIKIGDILLTTVATLGRSCIYNGFSKNLCFQRSVTVISTDIVPEYLKLFLDAPYFQKFIFNNATGTAQKGFYLNQLENVLVCVPPLSEQTRMLQTADAVLKQLIRLEESLN